VWGTLSKAKHANEKLAWDGEGKNYHFFMPPQSPLKEDTDCSVMLYPTSFESEWCCPLRYCGRTNKSKVVSFFRIK